MISIKKSKLLKKLSVILVIFIVLYIGATYLLNVFLPQKIRAEAKKFAKERLNKEIEISQINLGIFRGVSLKDVLIYEKDKTIPYLKVKRVYASIFYPSLLLRKKLLISLHLNDVYFKLERDKKGKFNIPLMDAAGKKESPFYPVRKNISQTKFSNGVYLKKIRVENLNLDFEDEGKIFRKQFSGLYFWADLSLSGEVILQLIWKEKISLKGNYNLFDKSLKAKISIKDIDLAEFKSLISEIELKSGKLTEGNLDLEGKATYSLRGNLKIVDIFLVKDGLEFKGGLDLSPKISLGDGKISYNLEGNLKEGEIKNLPQIGQLSEIKADFNLDNEDLKLAAIEAKIKNNPLRAKAQINHYHFRPQAFCLQAETNLALADFISIIKEIRPSAFTLLENKRLINFVSEKRGNIALGLDLKGNLAKKEFAYSLNYEVKLEQIQAKGQLNSHPQPHLDLQAKGNFATGEFIQLAREINPSFFTGERIKALTGFLSEEGGNLDLGLNLKGDLTKKEFAYAIDYELKSKQIQARGQINSHPQAQISLQAKATLSLNKFIQLAKEAKFFTFAYDGLGSLDLDLTLKGNLSEKDFTYFAKYKIKNASYAELKDVGFGGSFATDELTLEGGSLVWRSLPLAFNAALKNFASPEIFLNIKSEILNLQAKAKYNKDEKKIIVKEANLESKETNIFSKADIAIKDPPFFKIEGQGITSFKDILKIIALLKINIPPLAKLNPQGNLDTKFALEGASRQLKEWNGRLSASSEKLNVYNLEGRDVEIELSKDKDAPIEGLLLANLGEGKVDFRTKLDLLRNQGVMNLILNEIDLTYLREPLNIESERLAGKLSLQAYLKNIDLETWDNLEGSGKLLLREGNIWEVSFFKNLEEFLFTSKSMSMKFEQGDSDLVFKGKDIIFENILLDSQKMRLSGAGTISLKRDDLLKSELNFKLFPVFGPELASSPQDQEKVIQKKIISDILGKAGPAIQITGTLKDPKIKPIFLSPLEGIEKGIKSIFDELLSPR